jgi:hypothetical protein
MDLQILLCTLVATFLLKLLLLKSSEMVIIGLQFFEILINSQDLVTSAKNSLGKSVFLLCLCNMFSLIFHFLNGA